MASNYLRQNRGVSLIALVVAVTIATGISYALIAMISGNYKITGRVDKSVRVQTLMAETASAIQKMDYGEVKNLCSTFDGVAVPRSCVDTVNNKLTPTPAGESKVPMTSATLEVRRDWNGKKTATGPACIELSSCKTVVTNKLLEVTLAGYWEEAGNPPKVMSRTVAFRKALW